MENSAGERDGSCIVGKATMLPVAKSFSVLSECCSHESRLSQLLPGSDTRHFHHQLESLQENRFTFNSTPLDVHNPRSCPHLQKDVNCILEPNKRRLSVVVGWERGPDIDISALLLNGDLHVADIVWYRQPKSSCNSVAHTGNRTLGDGYAEETINVDLDSLPISVHHIAIVASIFTYDICFDDVRFAYVKVINADSGNEQQQTLSTFELGRMSGCSMLMCQFTRKRLNWNFRSLAVPTTGRSITQFIRNPSNFDSLTRRPSVAPTYIRISVAVEKWTNLVLSDPSESLQTPTTSSVFYTLVYRQNSVTSETVAHTPIVVWQPAAFAVGLVAESEQSPFMISIFERDTTQRDRLIGSIKLPIEALFNLGIGEHVKVLDLKSPQQETLEAAEVCGSIHLKIYTTE